MKWKPGRLLSRARLRPLSKKGAARMLLNPEDQYKLAKIHQQQLRDEADVDKLANEAAGERPQRTAHMLAVLAPWVKARGRATPAIVDSPINLSTYAAIQSSHLSAASAHTPPCAQAV